MEFLTCVQEEFGECGRPRVGWQIDPFGHAREHAHIMAKVFIKKIANGNIKGTVRLDWIGLRVVSLEGLKKDINRYRFFIF